MKGKKRISTLVIVLVLVAVLSTSAMAVYAWGDIDVNLPANQNDTRIGPVARSDSDSDIFCVGIDSISDGFTTVRAWAETWTGANLSSPYWIIDAQGWLIPYSTKPSMGTNVYLKLDNPVYTASTPHVLGTWSPY